MVGVSVTAGEQYTYLSWDLSDRITGPKLARWPRFVKDDSGRIWVFGPLVALGAVSYGWRPY